MKKILNIAEIVEGTGSQVSELPNILIDLPMKPIQINIETFNLSEFNTHAATFETSLEIDINTLNALDKLKKHKAVLNSVGVGVTSGLGNMNFSSKISLALGVSYPSLVRKSLKITKKKKISISDSVLPAITSKKNLKASPQSLLRVNMQNTFPVGTSYITANTLQFSGNTNIELDATITDLIIIADNLIVDAASQITITWVQPVLNTPNPLGDVNGVGEGQEGISGIKGNKGSDANYAPNIEIWTINPNIASSIIVNIAGQNGSNGSNGQTGGTGGTGSKGEDSTDRKIRGISIDCTSGPQSGNAGGRGGNGGDGGDGGTGGNGGNFEVYAINTLAFTNSTTVNNNGGVGGSGGNKGAGGNGGAGGSRGDAFGMCANTNWENQGRVQGQNGSTGSEGVNGLNGNNGNNGNPFMPISITFAQYASILSNPGIISIVPASGQLRVNDILKIYGTNFSAIDQISLIPDDGGTPITIPASSITFTNSSSTQPNQLHKIHIPNITGGRYSLQVFNGSLLSNIIHINVLATITSISVPRAKPGQQISILGSGFSLNSKVCFNNQVISVQNFINPNRIDFVVKRPTSFTTNMDGEIVSLSVIDNQNNTSNTLAFTIDTYKICFIGDSIMACQGFDENDGFAELMRQQVQANNPQIGVYMINRAHSGATLTGNNSDINLDKEIPRSSPSINNQLDYIISPDRAINDNVELIILDGGINDMEIKTFLTPEIIPDYHQNRLQDISTKAQQYCHDDLKNLLYRIANEFVSAKVIVTGYYQVISNQSNSLHLVSNFISTSLLGTVGGILGQVAFDSVVAQCSHAAIEMNRKMLLAVNEINSELNTTRFVFVDVDFKEENALFAPNSFLWDFDILGNVDDPQSNNRRNICSIYSGDDRKFCEMASTGHPNVKGRQQYLDKIMAVV